MYSGVPATSCSSIVVSRLVLRLFCPLPPPLGTGGMEDPCVTSLRWGLLKMKQQGLLPVLDKRVLVVELAARREALELLARCQAVGAVHELHLQPELDVAELLGPLLELALVGGEKVVAQKTQSEK